MNNYEMKSTINSLVFSVLALIISCLGIWSSTFKNIGILLYFYIACAGFFSYSITRKVIKLIKMKRKDKK